jgi:hypothetical protein
VPRRAAGKDKGRSGRAAGAKGRKGTCIRGDAGSVSPSDLCDATFKDEARKALESCKHDFCPWANSITAVSARGLHDDGDEVYAYEGSLVAYCEEENAGACCDVLLSDLKGVQVVWPTADQSAPAAPTAATAIVADDAAGSSSSAITPIKPSLPVKGMPRKYLFGEAYSGTDREKMRDKVAQLETMLHCLVRRSQDRYPDVVITDVTEVVGAAVLVFCADIHTNVRKTVLADGVSILRAHMGPTLRRLSEAGRLAVMVLSKSEAPQTFTYRLLGLAMLGKIRIFDSDDDDDDSDDE